MFGKASPEEKTIIEHAWKRHNDIIFSLISEGSIYLDPKAPEEITKDLLEHILQWNNVYHMKYIDRTYDGPVFAGIAKFGYKPFPKGEKIYFNKETKEKGLDGYFNDKSKDLKNELYEQLKDAI
jgi:hypothetical protein